MSKKSLIQKNVKRKKLDKKFFNKRQFIKNAINQELSLAKKFHLHIKLQQLPLNSSPIRLKNRCMFSGRSKGFFRDFGISRHFLREMAHEGLLPGVFKASW